MPLSDHRKQMRIFAYEEIIALLKEALKDGSIDERLMNDGCMDDERSCILNFVASEMRKYQQKAEAFNAN